MLRLLAVCALAMLVGGSMGVASPPADAAGQDMIFFLYHPDGSATVDNLLSCGWHDNCINGPDGGAALDWVPANPSYTQTWVRLMGVTNSSSPVWGAREEFFYQEFPCKQVQTNIMRISDWAIYGYVHQYHSGGNPNHNYANLYANNAGYKTSAVAGYILPHLQDNCSSTGDHTHQFYQSGPNDTYYRKNYAISSACDLCFTPYGIWQTYEYKIKWVTG